MNHMPEGCRPACAPRFTPTQGQYLAFIHAYTLVIGRPPAEADLQHFFQVTPPSVHQMVITLERNGLIRRRPGTARSIEVMVDPGAPPASAPVTINPSILLCRGTRHAPLLAGCLAAGLSSALCAVRFFCVVCWVCFGVCL